MSPSRRGDERRKKTRIQLSRVILARYGSLGVAILDITDSGARIEHFTRLDVGRKARLRLDLKQREIEVEATVRSCRLHRFAPGEETVYQSGLMFTDYSGDAAHQLKEMVATLVARSLAEQVANARGIGPVTERNMPVFRGGVMAGDGVDENAGEKAKRYLPDAALIADRGYMRCTLFGDRWDKKWTRQPVQPADGFTVRASELQEHIDQLCETYLKGSAEDRKLIQLMATASLEKDEPTPEPK